METPSESDQQRFERIRDRLIGDCAALTPDHRDAFRHLLNDNQRKLFDLLPETSQIIVVAVSFLSQDDFDFLAAHPAVQSYQVLLHDLRGQLTLFTMIQTARNL